MAAVGQVEPLIGQPTNQPTNTPKGLQGTRIDFFEENPSPETKLHYFRLFMGLLLVSPSVLGYMSFAKTITITIRY